MECKIKDVHGKIHEINFDNLDSVYINCDCMDALKGMPDKCVDVAICDPPYGINAPSMAMGTNKSRTKNGYPAESTASRLKRSGQVKEWDSKPPTEEYFKELFRVSKNQIIWGGNYFNLPPTKCFVVWDKVQPWDAFSQAEIAWTSYNLPAKLFRYSNTGGANTEKKIHPTQKPVALYEYLLQTFKINGPVLDTHVGSASSLIAYHRAGVPFVGFEIDVDMYKLSSERLEREKAQLSLFDIGMERNDNG